MDAAVHALTLIGLSDEQLAASYRDGVDACFDELVRRYSGPISTFILRMVGRPEDADDLTQEVFVQLLKSLPNARPDLPLRPWVYVIARNKCLDHLKRKRALVFSALTTADGEDAVEDRVVDDQPLPEELAERADLRDILQAAIAALPPRYRAVVALRYDTDLTFAEIGTVLDLPENTVKTHFQRAKALLRARLRDRL
jgi:RNA polymerase sigma-70 factor (ECF subfamily)